MHTAYIIDCASSEEIKSNWPIIYLNANNGRTWNHFRLQLPTQQINGESDNTHPYWFVFSMKGEADVRGESKLTHGPSRELTEERYNPLRHTTIEK